MAAATLYTPQVLALATGLAAWPWDAALPLQATARSRSCGSTVTLGLLCGADGRIVRLGIRAQACAVGQAAAAIFAGAAIGADAARIADARRMLAAWLAEEGPMPDWPGIAVLEAARAYPGRHGAIGLAWQAATELLPTA